jgi:hypothetical protein
MKEQMTFQQAAQLERQLRTEMQRVAGDLPWFAEPWYVRTDGVAVLHGFSSAHGERLEAPITSALAILGSLSTKQGYHSVWLALRDYYVPYCPLP